MKKIDRSIYDRLDAASIVVVGAARERALRSESGTIETEDLLCAVSTVAANNVITNALMVAVGLTKTAILGIIGDRIKKEVMNANVEWPDTTQRVLIGAAAFADEHHVTNVNPVHILYALAQEAQRNQDEGVGLVVHKAAPNLDLAQFLRAIEDLLDGADRQARINDLDREIAKVTATSKLLKSVRSMHSFLLTHS